MRIVHICLCGAMTDGFNYQENVIAKYHRKMGFDVTVITSQWIWGTDGKRVLFKKTNYFNDDHVKIIRLPVKCGTDENRLKLYPNLYKTVEIEKPDILFIHGCQFLNVLTLAKYAKRNPNVKMYLDNHVDYSNGAHGWISRHILHKGLWRFCVKKIEPYVTKFYGVLPARVDFLKELYDLPANKCELLVMGADDEFVEKAEKEETRGKVRKKYGISEEDFLIVTGGKIDLFKKQTILLMQAIEKIENTKLKLIVFGSVAQELKASVARLVDGKKIQYIGWVNSKDSYQLFAAADLVVFPGRHSVFWEQVAGQGIPMLVKYWEGTAHIECGGNVEFLYRDDEQEIEEKIQDILKNERYARMKTSAESCAMKFRYKEIAKESIEYTC